MGIGVMGIAMGPAEAAQARQREATARALKAVGTVFFEINRFDVSVVHGVLNDVKRSAAAAVSVSESAVFSLEVEKRRTSVRRELNVELHGTCEVTRFQQLLVQQEPPGVGDGDGDDNDNGRGGSGAGAGAGFGGRRGGGSPRKGRSGSGGSGSASASVSGSAASSKAGRKASGSGKRGAAAAAAAAAAGAGSGSASAGGAGTGAGATGTSPRKQQQQRGRKRQKLIFGIPPSRIHMITTQGLNPPSKALHSAPSDASYQLLPRVAFVFRSDFNNAPIVISTDIRDYTYLKEIAQSCSNSISGAWPAKAGAGAGAPAAPSSQQRKDARAFVPDASEREPFVFEPQVSVTGEATTIALGIVMNRLDLNREKLPEHLHRLLTDNLEAILAGVHDGLRLMDRAFGDGGPVNSHDM